MNSNFRVSVSSPPDRNYLVAEIMLNNEQVAELNQEKETLSLEIYPRQDGNPWLLNLDEMLEVLELVLCYRKGCSDDLFCVISNDAKKQTNHSINRTGLSFFDKHSIER